ncbi:MAG TPA: serine/threonine-protein kinase [Nostocaceae cyanobacterium]|nr:serine/threonine-protein kinase [Nostocaceae cyanobacterium]
MTCCTGCLYLHNPEQNLYCLQCGQPLLLKDRYRPLRQIGCGGFGRTFLAVDQHIPSQPECVIKQLSFSSADPATFAKAIALFRQEAVRLDELRHPQIPQLLAHFEQRNQLYLVQELIAGQTLAQELHHNGVFSEEKIWQVLQSLLPVLQFIHSHQVIHRDIKPANIMRRSAGGELVLIDFGVAKHYTHSVLQQTGTTIGSPEYMAPEQTRGKATPASDLYSLGVTCLNLLTGVSPFDLYDVSSDRWVWRDYLHQKVSDRLGQILDKLIENALSQRFQSAEQVLTTFQTQTQPVPKNFVFRLNSDTGVNYQQLQNFLITKKWQLADQETWKLMCQVLSKPVGSYIFSGDLEKFPCEDLQTIDYLWTKYSKGKFGFSPQVQIYTECEQDYGQFCTAVGWEVYNSTSARQKLLFNLSAPSGHLPSHFWVGGTQLGRHMRTLAAKLKSCWTVSLQSN